MYSRHEEVLALFKDHFRDDVADRIVYNISDAWDIETEFNTEWPNNTLAGVYFFLDSDFNLLYVGKSCDLAKRFWQYFKYSEKKSPRGVSKNQKSAGTRYIITIGLKKEFGWLAPSLEEFLILKLKPIRNQQVNRDTC
jgi:excinuclease UvrABC nuclease subunit